MNVEIKNLYAEVAEERDIKILKGIDLSLKEGSLNILMGPNGSGKSTVSHVIMGNGTYDVTDGEVLVDGVNILELDTHERARLGIFLSFQDPVEVTGITVGRFLRRAYEVLHKDVPTGFVKILRAEVDALGLDQGFLNRYLNEGFSGGEKKRMELLQARILKPKFLILDEIDSGLDIDAIKVIGKSINDMRKTYPSMSILVITHYRRIVDHLENLNGVHIMKDGVIIKSGSMDILDKLEDEGYGWLLEK